MNDVYYFIRIIKLYRQSSVAYKYEIMFVQICVFTIDRYPVLSHSMCKEMLLFILQKLEQYREMSEHCWQNNLLNYEHCHSHFLQVVHPLGSQHPQDEKFSPVVFLSLEQK